MTAIRIFSGGNGDDTSYAGENIGASIICKEFLKDRLKAPSTAKFAPTSDQIISSQGNDEYKVISYVDAENSFGAMIRTDYTCIVKYTGNDNWSLLDLQTTP